MKKQIIQYTILLLSLTFVSCSGSFVQLTEDNLKVVNREITAVDEKEHSVMLNNKRGDGLAIIEDVNFDVGTIEVEIKGENVQGKSFVGIAFNIQNDSTYEAVYFRPFNFQSSEKIRREHSVQYIHHPKKGWRFLRTNFEGQYEAEYPRQPSPDDWFKVLIKVDAQRVHVYDAESNIELLSVERLTEHTSDRVALWTGFNSKGAFRNLKIGR